MRKKSEQTIRNQLEKAEEKYYNLTIKSCGNWGDGMRKSKLPSLSTWEKAQERVKQLKRELEEYIQCQNIE